MTPLLTPVPVLFGNPKSALIGTLCAKSPAHRMIGFKSLTRSKPLEILGSGTSAQVELHQDKKYKLVAIKTFKPRESYESRKDYKCRCLHEYNLLVSLNNVNVLRCYDWHAGLHSIRIVMEYAPYTVLRLIQLTKPNEEELLCFFRQVCEGVAYLHSNCIAHRDLKMENLVVSVDAVVKIIDFGSAVKLNTDKRLKGTEPKGTGSNTATGLMGTEALISPEAQSSISYDAMPNDVWAIGVLLYSMLHLEFPWKAAVKSDAAFRRFMDNPEVLEDNLPHFGLISRALEIDPVERITMEELVKELDDKVGRHVDCEVKVHRRTMKVCSLRAAKALIPTH